MIEIKEGETVGNIKNATVEEFYDGIARHAPEAGAAVAAYMESFPEGEKGAAMSSLAVCVIGSVVVSCVESLKKAGYGDAEAEDLAARVVSRFAAVAHHTACAPPPTVH